MFIAGSIHSLASGKQRLKVFPGDSSYLVCVSSLTKDLLRLNATFSSEQLNLWFASKTGLYSAAPRSLGLAAPMNLFSPQELISLIEQSRQTLQDFATAFSNGNPNLERGIAAQLNAALILYSNNTGLPVELNLG